MSQTKPEFARMAVAVDLGFAGDPSAAAGIRQTARSGKPHYQLLMLRKWPLRTQYTAIIDDLRDMLAAPIVSGTNNPFAKAVLVLDKSGVGVPIYQQVQAAAINASHIVGLTITGGRQDGPATATKTNLVAGLVRVIGEKRFEAPATLPLADEFMRELSSFRAKATAAGNVTFNAEAGYHDDLISAVSLGLNYLERLGVPHIGGGPGIHTPPSMGGFDLRGSGMARAVDRAMREVFR